MFVTTAHPNQASKVKRIVFDCPTSITNRIGIEFESVVCQASLVPGLSERGRHLQKVGCVERRLCVPCLTVEADNFLKGFLL